MDILDHLLKRKKVVKTTTIIEETYEEEIDDEKLRETVAQELMRLDNRVRALEMEYELYKGD